MVANSIHFAVKGYWEHFLERKGFSSTDDSLKEINGYMDKFNKERQRNELGDALVVRFKIIKGIDDVFPPLGDRLVLALQRRAAFSLLFNIFLPHKTPSLFITISFI